MAVHRPDFRRRRYRRPRTYRGLKPPGAPERGFGLKVVGAAALVFVGVFYSERIPSALDTAVQFSRDVGRQNRPPPGAYYSGCNEARADGVAPLYAGEPGYRPEMDGDDDGVACEPYRGV